MLVLCFILLLNLGISWWNARVTGQVWVEANALGGFGKLLVWCGAIQSAVGFSMIYIMVLAGLGYATGILPVKAIHGMLSLWYVAIIIPALGSGFVIMLHSWTEAYKRRDFASIGTAAYNTIAMGHNSYQAMTGIGDAFSGIGDLFDGEDGAIIALAIIAVLFALGAGIATTYGLVQKYAGTLDLPARDAVSA